MTHYLSQRAASPLQSRLSSRLIRIERQFEKFGMTHAGVWFWLPAAKTTLLPNLRRATGGGEKSSIVTSKPRDSLELHEINLSADRCELTAGYVYDVLDPLGGRIA